MCMLIHLLTGSLWFFVKKKCTISNNKISFLFLFFLVLFLLFILAPLLNSRWWRRTWRRRFPCSSSWGSSSTRRTWPRSLSRTSPGSSSSCRWRMPSWLRTSTAPRRPPCSWRPMPFRPSLANTTQWCTSAATWPLSGCCPRGEWGTTLWVGPSSGFFIIIIIMKMRLKRCKSSQGGSVNCIST